MKENFQFARGAAESAHPELWEGLTLPLFAPCLDDDQHVRVLEDKSGYGTLHNFGGE